MDSENEDNPPGQWSIKSKAGAGFIIISGVAGTAKAVGFSDPFAKLAGELFGAQVLANWVGLALLVIGYLAYLIYELHKRREFVRKQLRGISAELKELTTRFGTLQATHAKYVDVAKEQVAQLTKAAGRDLQHQLVINSATYGSEKARVDVTAVVRSHLRNGTLSVRSGNHLGGDPEYNERKWLAIEYELDGKLDYGEYPEHMEVQIPLVRHADPGGGFKII